MDKTDNPRFFYGYTIILAAFCILFISYGLYGTFGIFFKPLLDEFGWDRATISGAYAISMFVHGVLGIVMGALNDRFGPRLVVMGCGIFLGAGYLLMSQLNTVLQLYLYYGLIIAIGISGIWVPLMSTVARWFAKRRGAMTGIIVAGAGIGSIVAPPVINWLIVNYGWRMTYIVVGVTTLIVIITAAQFLIRDPDKKNMLPDGEHRPDDDQIVFIPKSVSYTLRGASCSGRFWLAFLILIGFGYCMVAIKLHIVPYIIDTGISATIAANIFAIMGGTSILGNYVFGSVGDKIGSKQVFIIGSLLIIVILLFLLWSNNIWMFCLVSALSGFAFGGMATSESPLVADLFGLGSHGLIYGVLGLGFTVGASVGPYVTGYIFDIYGSYQPSFIICIAFAALCLISASLLKPSRMQDVISIQK